MRIPFSFFRLRSSFLPSPMHDEEGVPCLISPRAWTSFFSFVHLLLFFARMGGLGPLSRQLKNFSNSTRPLFLKGDTIVPPFSGKHSDLGFFFFNSNIFSSSYPFFSLDFKSAAIFFPLLTRVTLALRSRVERKILSSSKRRSRFFPLFPLLSTPSPA